jgi:hypothetical protein
MYLFPAGHMMPQLAGENNHRPDEFPAWPQGVMIFYRVRGASAAAFGLVEGGGMLLSVWKTRSMLFTELKGVTVLISVGRLSEYFTLVVINPLGVMAMYA